MVVSEESRHRLYARLEEVLGADEAETLMEHLPPVGWADVATKRDIDALTVATKRDIDTLREATNHRFDTLRAATDHRFDTLRAATDHRFDALEEATNHRFDAQRAATDHRFDILETKMERLATRDWIEEKLEKTSTRLTTQLIAVVTALIVFASVVLAVIKA